jgi:hypothetical protein
MKIKSKRKNEAQEQPTVDVRIECVCEGFE